MKGHFYGKDWRKNILTKKQLVVLGCVIYYPESGGDPVEYSVIQLEDKDNWTKLGRLSKLIGLQMEDFKVNHWLIIR